MPIEFAEPATHPNPIIISDSVSILTAANESLSNANRVSFASTDLLSIDSAYIATDDRSNYPTMVASVAVTFQLSIQSTYTAAYQASLFSTLNLPIITA